MFTSQVTCPNVGMAFPVSCAQPELCLEQWAVIGSSLIQAVSIRPGTCGSVTKAGARGGSIVHMASVNACELYQ